MKLLPNQGETACFFVSPTLVPKHKNMQLPSSATTFSSKTAILPQTSRIGPNAAKRNIIVIGENTCNFDDFKRHPWRALYGGRGGWILLHVVHLEWSLWSCIYVVYSSPLSCCLAVIVVLI
jgi:hypothetical protein